MNADDVRAAAERIRASAKAWISSQDADPEYHDADDMVHWRDQLVIADYVLASLSAPGDEVRAVVRDTVIAGVMIERGKIYATSGATDAELIDGATDQTIARLSPHLARGAADDGEAVSPEWIRTVGPIIRDDDAIIVQLRDKGYVSAQLIWECDWTGKHWRGVVRIYGRQGIDNAVIVEVATRGAVRHLAAALGIPLSSPTTKPAQEPTV